MFHKTRGAMNKGGGGSCLGTGEGRVVLCS